MLMLSLVAAFGGCDSTSQDLTNQEPQRHIQGIVEFSLPANWVPVPEFEGTLFMQDGVHYDKLQIAVRSSHNPRVGSQKIRKQWLSIRDRLAAQGDLLNSSTGNLGRFERFDWVRSSKAPSEELIPKEYQTAGDTTFHNVNLISSQGSAVTAHLIVEVANYDTALPIFEEMLLSIQLLNFLDGQVQ